LWQSVRTWLPRVVVLLAVVSLFSLVLPHVLAVDWHLVVTSLLAIPIRNLVLLGLIWIVGLGLHTFTLTAALPGLTHRQALQLSLTGSAIANVLPVGGAAGIALNGRMVGSWGFDRHAFAAYTVVTNVWDVMAKLLLPLLALPLLLGPGASVLGWLGVPSVLGAAGIGLAGLLVALMIASERVTSGVGALLDAAVSAVLRAARARRPVTIGSFLVHVRHRSAALIHRGWPRLTFGMLAYVASLAVLLYACCWVAGVALPTTAIALGFVVERLLTLAGITPGGAGVIEVGLGAVLVFFGGAAIPVATAVLLYRIFTFGIEIPVGGLGIAAWLAGRRRAASVA
jgi:uncharacterized membrane protein YbhN (UPF0104 family)